MNAPPRAVAVYIRWSTEEQTEGTTLEVQRERCSLFIRAQGWTYHPELTFIDDGYSGGTLNRPALTRLRAAIRAGQVDCVVSYSIDRLSRNLADIVALVQREWVGRAVFRSASQPISTEEGNPAGQLIFNMLASFAEFERGLIRERTFSGIVRRAQEGKYMGARQPPLGYRRTATGTLTIDAVGPDGGWTGPALVVSQIFAQARTGAGPTAIARRLNGLGLPAPLGGSWGAGSVRGILRNPIYAGTVVYGRRRSVPLATATGSVPPIVGQAEWEAVQALAAGRSRRRGAHPAYRALLAGMLRCPCGGPLHLTYKAGRRFYRCTRNAQGGACPFSPGHYRAELIETAVAAELKARYSHRAAAAAKQPLADPWSPLALAEQRAVLGALVREVEVHRARRSGAPLAVCITWHEAATNRDGR